jgi:hypothetical protein
MNAGTIPYNGIVEPLSIGGEILLLWWITG